MKYTLVKAEVPNHSFVIRVGYEHGDADLDTEESFQVPFETSAESQNQNLSAFMQTLNYLQELVEERKRGSGISIRAIYGKVEEFVKDNNFEHFDIPLEDLMVRDAVYSSGDCLALPTAVKVQYFDSEGICYDVIFD